VRSNERFDVACVSKQFTARKEGAHTMREIVCRDRREFRSSERDSPIKRGDNRLDPPQLPELIGELMEHRFGATDEPQACTLDCGG
jgi:hypothetical protein